MKKNSAYSHLGLGLDSSPAGSSHGSHSLPQVHSLRAAHTVLMAPHRLRPLLPVLPLLRRWRPRLPPVLAQLLELLICPRHCWWWSCFVFFVRRAVRVHAGSAVAVRLPSGMCRRFAVVGEPVQPVLPHDQCRYGPRAQQQRRRWQHRPSHWMVIK
jgi:hypothetical protein